jgi:DNA-directed RNA polymerase specialized sigma24 family protein
VTRLFYHKGVAFVRFQWLKNYQDLEEQILFMKWNLNKSRLELDRWVNGDLANVRLEKNSRSSSLEENIRIIENELALLEKEQVELLELIDSFSGADNQIVKLKYIDDMDVYDIADETGYSVSYIRKRHTEIRKTLSFVDEYETRREERLKKQEEMDYYSADQDQLSLF